MIFTDAAEIVGTRLTADGYLVADVRVARGGNVQRYLGREVGKPDLPFVDVYRPHEEVFAADAMRTFAHRPVTIEHPTEPVAADNWRDLAVGHTGEDVVRDGEFIRVPMMLMDRRAIDAVASGKREISMGYISRLEFTEGTAPNGSSYQAIQRDLRMNHAAIVDQGRAGPQCRIGDWVAPENGFNQPQPKEQSMTDANRTALVVDGLTVSIEARDAQIVQRHIDKLTSDNASLQTRIADMEKKAKEDAEEKEAEFAKKDAALDDLKAKVLSDADIDARVQARGDLIATARAIVGDVDFKGRPDADIRKTVVVTKLGDAAIAGKAQAYIDARFDILAEAAAKGDPIRDAARVKDGTAPVNTNDAETAYAEHVAALSNAWKGAA